MLPAFLEAIRATAQPCTLLLLAPPIVMAIATRARWAPLAAIGVGAILGGWLFVANLVALDGWQLQASGVLVIALIALVVLAPTVSALDHADTQFVQLLAAGTVAFVCTLWWRPCIGTELGAILTASRRGVPGQLPGISAYMLGALVPVLAVVLVLRAVDPSPATSRRAALAGSAIGVLIAGALALGRHDELVTALTRWTTN